MAEGDAIAFVIRAMVVNRHRLLDERELRAFARAAEIVSDAGLNIPPELDDPPA